jgi:hypothetical protein
MDLYDGDKLTENLNPVSPFCLLLSVLYLFFPTLSFYVLSFVCN